MNLQTFREYCLSKPKVTEDCPFDDITLVFRVCNKIFALTDINRVPFRFNLKCDPEKAIELREQYENIIPAWHMNKKLWNTIEPDGEIREQPMGELIDCSYDLIVEKLSTKQQED